MTDAQTTSVRTCSICHGLIFAGQQTRWLFGAEFHSDCYPQRLANMSKMRDADMPLTGRIDAAIERITHGQAAMRVPVEATDPDVVLADCQREIERLTAALQYEQHRADRQGTHGDGCADWGPAHYECAIRERDDLRRQLDEAEQDARRYRWIAGHCRSTSEHWGGRWSIIVDGPAPKAHDSEDAFDAAIDAADRAGAQRAEGGENICGNRAKVLDS